MVMRTSRAAAADPIAERMAYFRARLLSRAWPNLVGGRQDVSGRAFEVLCPFDRNIIAARLVAADGRAVAAAAQAARKAQGVWAALKKAEREEMLGRLSDRLAARRADLALALMFERGTARAEALAEVDGAISCFQDFSEKLPDATRPAGVAGLIVQAGEPFKLLCAMAAAALMAGNGVLIRPAPQAGLAAALFMEAAGEAGLPEGLLNLLFGDEAAGLIAECGGVDLIAAAAPMELALKWQKKAQGRPFLMRAKGRNAAIVAAGADLDRAAEVIAASAFRAAGAGLSCISTVIAQGDAAQELALKLRKAADGFRPGPATDAATRMGAVLEPVEKLERLAKSIRARARLITGGEGARPVIGTGLAPEHAAARDELFLPVLVIEKAAGFEAALERSRSLPGGNLLALFSPKAAHSRAVREGALQGAVFIEPETVPCAIPALFTPADFRLRRRVFSL